jgi:hypothetical protein
VHLGKSPQFRRQAAERAGSSQDMGGHVRADRRLGEHEEAIKTIIRPIAVCALGALGAAAATAAAAVAVGTRYFAGGAPDGE